MKRYIRVGSSDYKKYREELQTAHEELQELLASGWNIGGAASVRKRRPRIKKEKTPRKVIISIFGSRMTISYSEYAEHCSDFKVIELIY